MKKREGELPSSSFFVLLVCFCQCSSLCNFPPSQKFNSRHFALLLTSPLLSGFCLFYRFEAKSNRKQIFSLEVTIREDCWFLHKGNIEDHKTSEILIQLRINSCRIIIFPLLDSKFVIWQKLPSASYEKLSHTMQLWGKHTGKFSTTFNSKASFWRTEQLKGNFKLLCKRTGFVYLKN